MTRTEFSENMCGIWDLYDFCMEEDCDILNSMMSDDAFNDYINESLVEWARYDTWDALRDRLNGYADIMGADAYIFDDYEGDYRAMDEREFDDYYRAILDWADENDVFDPEDEEDDDPVPEPCVEEYEMEQPDCSLDEMFSDSTECVTAYRNHVAREREETDIAFKNMMEWSA